MTSPENTPAQSILSRNLFGFAVLALLPMAMTWLMWLLSPVSPDAGFAQIRTVIVIAGGVLTLLCVGLCAWTLFASEASLERAAKGLVTIFGHRWLLLIAIPVLLEINLLSGMLLADVAPAIVAPARFLMICWSLLMILLLVIANLPALQRWWRQSRLLWMGAGLLMLFVGIISILQIVNFQLIAATGINDRLRGGLDYRQLEFIDDGNMPASGDFWAEQTLTRVTWLPYVYWRMDEYDGKYINISPEGIRYTPDYSADNPAAQTIYFFGGSTMWGEGARDAYTIPSQVAQMLVDDDAAQKIVNYGQTGYNSTQDMLLFQMQLAQGNIPDVAVFYQGFNDIWAAYSQGITGITLQEGLRVADSETGRLLRAGQPVLQPLTVDLASQDFALMSDDAATSEAILSRWLANQRMVRAIAAEYGVEVLFVWQPTLIRKQLLTSSENGIVERTRTERPGLFEIYDNIDKQVRAYFTENPAEDVLLPGDVFVDNDRAIFHDLVHITEAGNQMVADAIMPALMQLLKIR